MSTLTYLSFFLFIYFLYVLLCGTNRLYARLSLLSHEFEQFGSLHICVHQGNITAVAGLEPGATGVSEPGTPGLRVNHATNELLWRQGHRGTGDY